MSSNIQNLKSFDPFADTGAADSSTESNLIHIRIQQRNGRKTLTTVQGLPEEYDLKKILRECKQSFACNGTIIDDKLYGEIIQLQGDQREVMRQFLVKQALGTEAQVKVHGF